MQKIRVVYYLSDEAQKKYLLTGEDASKKQVLYIDATPEILNLPICKMDADGNAVICFETPLFSRKHSTEEVAKALMNYDELCEENHKKPLKQLLGVAILIGFWVIASFYLSDFLKMIGH